MGESRNSLAPDGPETVNETVARSLERHPVSSNAPGSPARQRVGETLGGDCAPDTGEP